MSGCDDLLRQLSAPDAKVDELIPMLASRACELKPEDIINHAVKLDAVHGNQLLRLLASTEQSPDLANVSIQPDVIEDTPFKINLLDYLGGINQSKSPLLIARFLKDTNSLISFEALRALQRLTISFDASFLLPPLHGMTPGEQSIAMKIVTRNADSSLVGHLSDYLDGDSSKVNGFLAGILAEHVDTENFEKFLKRLSLEDESRQTRAIACIQKFSSKKINQAASALSAHEHEFVRDCAQQLVSSTLDDSDILKMEKFAENDNPQVRERAIQSLGKSANRAALAILKRVARRWPDDSELVLKATRKLGFSKGLEIAFNCLDNSNPNVQREAIETIDAISNEKHAASIRETIIWKIPMLADDIKDHAKSLIIKLTWDYRLPALQLDESTIDKAGIADLPIWNEDAEKGDDQSETPQIRSLLDDLKPGFVWMDRYHINKEVGRGAMGRVMLAEDDMVDELIILKFMRPELITDESAAERFKREVKYTRRVGHKNVIRVYDLLIRDELCSISMEYFKSQGLEAILKETGAFAVRDGLKILYQISNGMVAAHEQGVIHRDLKPSNILIGSSGLTKIVDFGIASARSSAESTLTQTGSIIGSPAYLAPERTRDLKADERSDIYSLGIIAYYLLGGKLPYQGKTMEVLNMHCQGGAPEINQINRLISPKIAKMVAGLMMVDPDQRPQTMAIVRNQIRELLKTE